MKTKNQHCPETDCGELFGSKSKLEAHMRSKHGAAMLSCGITDCPKKFTDHPDELIACEMSKCKAVYGCQEDLDEHNVSSPGQTGSHKCVDCGAALMSADLLKNHISASKTCGAVDPCLLPDYVKSAPDFTELGSTSYLPTRSLPQSLRADAVVPMSVDPDTNKGKREKWTRKAQKLAPVQLTAEAEILFGNRADAGSRKESRKRKAERAFNR